MKTNKIVLICAIVAIVGLIICGIGFFLGGSVYGFSLGRKGVVVNSGHNTTDGTGLSFVQESKDLESFESLEMDIAYADVEFRVSDRFGIEYNLREDRQVTTKLSGTTMSVIQDRPNGGLTIFSVGNVNIGNFSQREYVIIYVPKDITFDQIKIGDKFGEVEMDNVTANSLIVEDSFGNVKMKQSEAKTIKITLDSGDLTADQFMTEELTIEDKFGSVTIETVMSDKSDIVLNSGDLEIESLEGTELSIRNKFGKVQVDKSILSGKCYINSDSGDTILGDTTSNETELESSFGKIEAKYVKTGELTIVSESGDCIIESLSCTDGTITEKFGNVEIGVVEKVESYSCDMHTDFGSIYVNDEDMETKYKVTNSNNTHSITVENNSGDIEIYDVK